MEITKPLARPQKSINSLTNKYLKRENQHSDVGKKLSFLFVQFFLYPIQQQLLKKQNNG